jgi:glycosyltransferase involved in cell wall biosynthesis
MLRYGKTVLPLKLFIYLAAGRPIMAPQLADMLGILSEHNALLVPPDDVTSAVTSMRRLFARPQWQEAMAVKASHDARKYTWRNRAGRIIDFLNDRLGDA